LNEKSQKIRKFPQRFFDRDKKNNNILAPIEESLSEILRNPIMKM